MDLEVTTIEGGLEVVEVTIVEEGGEVVEVTTTGEGLGPLAEGILLEVLITEEVRVEAMPGVEGEGLVEVTKDQVMVRMISTMRVTTMTMMRGVRWSGITTGFSQIRTRQLEGREREEAGLTLNLQPLKKNPMMWKLFAWISQSECTGRILRVG